MTLSIITINYNNRLGLQKTIDSVICQTFTDYEWIVIDGGSTDGSRELIEQYADHFAYWCSEPDKGIYNAMNKGIAHAKGEWLQFLNSGDWLYEDTTLEKVFSKEYKADILYGDAIYFWGNKKAEKRFPQTITLYSLITESVNHQTCFIKSHLFKTQYDESFNYYADWVKLFEWFFKDVRFEYLQNIIVYYDATGLTSTPTDKLKEEENRVLREAIPLYLQNDVPIIKEHQSLLQQQKEYNSHKAYRIVNKSAQTVNTILSKIIKLIEKKKFLWFTRQ